MFISTGKQLSLKLSRSVSRAFSSRAGNDPYWKAKFPNGVASFDEIPTVTEKYDTRKLPEVYEGWFKKYGYVVKEPMPYGKYNVHIFHFDDFRTVYMNDGSFPIRQSHHIIAQYREERKHLYDHVGLGPGQGQEWRNLREMILQKVMFYPYASKSEDAVDDLIEIIKNNRGENGEIELKPWLHRWAFESIGIVALNRRMNALSKTHCELADKMVKAGALSDEIIALTTMDPITMKEEYYKQFCGAQDFFDGVVRKKVDEIKRYIELEPEPNGVAQILFQKGSYSENDIITVIMDLFHGSLQTTPLTALMALYNVARNPEVQAKAREELKQNMPRRDVRMTDIKESIPFTKEIVYETLRLNPPIIGNGRLIQKDLVLGGYSVPAFTNVLLHFQVACRQEENFKDALSFLPGRADFNYRKIMQVFGGSSRVCPGMHFSLGQAFLLISKIIRNFEISYDGDEVKMINKLHNIPDKPLILKLKPVED